MTPPYRWTLALAALLAAAPSFALNHENVIAPIPAGTYAVACSNLEQDVSLLAPGTSPSDYWEGRLINDQLHYITQILSHPETVIRFDPLVPDDRSIYPNTANTRVPFVAIVCHPTSRYNTAPDYALPGGVGVIPHMQPAGQPPYLIDQAEFRQSPLTFNEEPIQRLPLIVYSHGLGGSPIGKGYIDTMVALAAHGYMVAAVFHADARFSRIRVENLNDFLYLLTQYDRVAEMELMRPVALKAMTDTLLAHPYFKFGIDPERIAGFGASLGGQAMLNLMGAKMTTSVGLACRETVRDPRIKVGVGFVTYAGQTFLPAFCNDQSGADLVDRPFLTLAGTADTTAPLKVTQQAINRLKGSRFLVELVDGQHELRAEDIGDLFTWMITFYRAYLQGDAAAMASFIKMRGVIGGREDNLNIDAHVPTQLAAGEMLAAETSNGDRYFLATTNAEIDSLKAAGWLPTGYSFKAWSAIPASATTNCHFATAFITSGDVYRPCGWTKRLGRWTFDEPGGFFIEKADAAGSCAAGLLQVNRLYQPRYALSRTIPNERLVTSDSAAKESVANGWIQVPATMCARP